MSVAANRYAKALMDVLYPEKAEAGDVRHRVNSELEAEFRGPAIELEHHIDGGLNVFG